MNDLLAGRERPWRHGALRADLPVPRRRVYHRRDLGTEGQARAARRRRARRRDARPAADHHPVPPARAVRHLGAVPAGDRDHRGCAGRRAPRPRGIVRRADPPVALGRVPGRLLRGRGQLELLHGLVHPGPLRLHHRGDQALARGRPDVAQPAGSPTPTASSPTPSGRPTTSTTPGCSAVSTTPSTSWAAGPRCTTRQAAASSTESWSRPAAGSTSATPTAPPVRDSLSMWTFLSDAGRKVQKDLDIKEYTDPHHDPMIPTRSCSSRAWSSTASTTATGTGAGRRSRTSAVIFAR